MREEGCRDRESQVQKQNYIDKVCINLKKNVKYKVTAGKLDDSQLQYKRKGTLNHTRKWNNQT